MDDTDRKLLLLIASNPRMQFQELAAKLGISRQAVYCRLQTLTRIGVIKGMKANISVSYLDAIPVAIFGVSQTSSMDTTLDRLGESEHTRRVVLAGGNYLYVAGFLRDISELNRYVEFVRRAADMPAPTVGLYSSDAGLMPHYPVDGVGERTLSRGRLSPLDLRIIAALKDDARRPMVEIAGATRTSVKTVRRHLERMISEGTLDMNIPVDMASGGDMMLILHADLNEGADKGGVGRRLLSKCKLLDSYVIIFSNLPGFLLLVFWSDKITDIRKVLKETSEDKDVRSAMLNFTYFERIYPTWRDKLLEIGPPPSEKKRATSKRLKTKRMRSR